MLHNLKSSLNESRNLWIKVLEAVGNKRLLKSFCSWLSEEAITEDLAGYNLRQRCTGHAVRNLVRISARSWDAAQNGIVHIYHFMSSVLKFENDRELL